MRVAVWAVVWQPLNSDELTKEPSYLESSWQTGGMVPAAVAN
jgi:hypothetical protein